MKRAFLAFLAAGLAGCGGGGTTVVEQSTTTETVTQATTVTTARPFPEPDANKVVECFDFRCYQHGGFVEVSFDRSINCGTDGNGTWRDAGTDPRNGASLYKCVDGPAP